LHKINLRRETVFLALPFTPLQPIKSLSLIMEESCTNIQVMFKEILKVKQEGGGAEKFKSLLRDAALELVRLKLAAKSKVDEIEQQKAATAESKAQADESNLRLQNLLYEKNYYNKEIAACLAFK